MSSSNGNRDYTFRGISDIELLAIVDDLADSDGWASNFDIRMQLGEKPEKGDRSGVGSRMAWMRRYGWLEQNADRHHRLTSIGHVLLEKPKLSEAFARNLHGLNPAQRLAVTQEIAESGAHGADEIRIALRRQWRRSL
jgi:hypothetical protein